MKPEDITYMTTSLHLKTPNSQTHLDINKLLEVLNKLEERIMNLEMKATQFGAVTLTNMK